MNEEKNDIKCTMCGKKFDDEDIMLGDNTYDIYVNYPSKHDLERIKLNFCVDCFDKVLDMIIPLCKINPIVDEDWSKLMDHSDVSIKFGSFPQNNTIATPIEWLVLDTKDDQVLVISKYALACKPYNDKFDYSSWEKCSLRKWLNEDFYNNAFSKEEQQRIINSPDKIFLLSREEANKYFNTAVSRICAATACAKAEGAFTSEYKTKGGDECYWWLRSPGTYDTNSAVVDVDGSVNRAGVFINAWDACVRPAMWIKYPA